MSSLISLMDFRTYTVYSCIVVEWNGTQCPHTFSQCPLLVTEVWISFPFSYITFFSFIEPIIAFQHSLHIFHFHGFGTDPFFLWHRAGSFLFTHAWPRFLPSTSVSCFTLCCGIWYVTQCSSIGIKRAGLEVLTVHDCYDCVQDVRVGTWSKLFSDCGGRKMFMSLCNGRKTCLPFYSDLRKLCTDIHWLNSCLLVYLWPFWTSFSRPSMTPVKPTFLSIYFVLGRRSATCNIVWERILSNGWSDVTMMNPSSVCFLSVQKFTSLSQSGGTSMNASGTCTIHLQQCWPAISPCISWCLNVSPPFGGCAVRRRALCHPLLFGLTGLSTKIWAAQGPYMPNADNSSSLISLPPKLPEVIEKFGTFQLIHESDFDALFSLLPYLHLQEIDRGCAELSWHTCNFSTCHVWDRSGN